MTQNRVLACLFALVCMAPLVGCVTNPATGRSQFNVLSREDEIAIGEEAKGQLADEYGGAVPDAGVQAYMTEIGMKLVDGIEDEYKDLPWEFTLLNSEQINAFALPGGKVFMTRGLAEKLDSEAQLAGILGHEIGHVTAEHADQRISKQLILTGIVIGTAVAASGEDSELVRAGAPLLVGAGGQGFLLKFSRDDELEADRLGMRYMTNAWYTPRAQKQVMQVLDDASEGKSRPPEWLSTHPYPARRIKEIDKQLGGPYQFILMDPDYGEHHARYRERMLEPLSRIPAN